MMRTLWIIALVIWVMVSCNDLSQKKIVGNYYLVAGDYDKKQTSLSYHVGDGNFAGIVDAEVLGAGYNENYIIVKQASNGKPIKDTVYYIVPIAKKYTFFPEHGVFGPLDYSNFILKQEQLGLSDVRFTVAL